MASQLSSAACTLAALVLVCLLTNPLAAQAEAPRRVAPAALPPTQRDVIREQRRAQIALDGENQFRYAREVQADGFQLRARQLLQNFLILFPDHPRRFAALELLAEIETELDRPEAAARAYRRAFAAVPREDRGLRAALAAGRLYAGLGQSDTAREIFEMIAARQPGSALAREVAIELQALGLPIRYDRSAISESAANSSETRSETGPGGTTPGVSLGRNNSDNSPNATESGADRGLLDANSQGDSDDGRQQNSGSVSTAENAAPGGSTGTPQSLSETDTTGGAEGSQGMRGSSDRALELMGEGVERLPQEQASAESDLPE